MKARSSFFLVIAVTVLLFTYDSAVAGTEEIDKVETAADVISEIMDIPEKGMPVTLLRNAYGIAIVPGVIKVGFVLGGRYGKGILLIQDNKDEWSNPSFITLTGGSVGWQIGAQSTDIILVFKNRKSIKGIIKGKFTLGADAAIAAGPVGRQAEAGTDIQLRAEIYSYSRSRGLFAGIALEGAALQIDDNANAEYYSADYISPRDIFFKEETHPHPSAQRVKDTIKKHLEQ